MRRVKYWVYSKFFGVFDTPRFSVKTCFWTQVYRLDGDYVRHRHSSGKERGPTEDPDVDFPKRTGPKYRERRNYQDVRENVQSPLCPELVRQSH